MSISYKKLWKMLIDRDMKKKDLCIAAGIIQNVAGKDASGSHARKWRLMFAKNGFIFPQVKKSDGFLQSDLGPLDTLTPFGKTFLQEDTFPAVQECYLRAMSGNLLAAE